jgi:peroxiredoxin
MFCREQVAQLREALPAIRATGAELVVVGNGTPEHAKRFREDFGADFPLYVDPQLAAYRVAGLRRGVLQTLAPRVVGNALRAFSRGARQGAVMGDPWQLGGTFVVRTDGALAFQHVSREAGDHPRIEDVLRAVESLAQPPAAG